MVVPGCRRLRSTTRLRNSKTPGKQGLSSEGRSYQIRGLCLVDPANRFAPIQSDARKNLANPLGGEELTARLSCARGIHRHQILVGVTESINRRLPVGQVHVPDRVQDPHELEVSLSNSVAELGRINVNVGEEALHVFLRSGPI